MILINTAKGRSSLEVVSKKAFSVFFSQIFDSPLDLNGVDAK